jgi:hypothetical protein
MDPDDEGDFVAEVSEHTPSDSVFEFVVFDNDEEDSDA